MQPINQSLKWWFVEDGILPEENIMVLFQTTNWIWCGIYSTEKNREAFYKFCEPDIDYMVNIDEVIAWTYIEDIN